MIGTVIDLFFVACKVLAIVWLCCIAIAVLSRRIVTFDAKTGAQIGRLDVMLVVLFALMWLLGGCAHVPDVRVVDAGVTLPHKPNADFQCEDEPDPMRVRTDQDDAHYKNDLRHAWKDCRDRLGSVGRVWRETEAVQSRAIPPGDEGEEK